MRIIYSYAYKYLMRNGNYLNNLYVHRDTVKSSMIAKSIVLYTPWRFMMYVQRLYLYIRRQNIGCSCVYKYKYLISYVYGNERV